MVRKKLGKPNRGKVRNATKVEEFGYKFDSKLEHFFYKTCLALKIKCVVKPKTYTVHPAFTFQNEKIRPITYTPDFYLPDHKTVVETKGLANESFPLRLKLFKKHLVDMGDNSKYVQLKNQKEVTEYLTSLIQPS